MLSLMGALALSLPLIACSESDGRPAEGTWIEVVPGGDTICSRGSDYRFFVRGGDPQRVIIDFQGGGACWNAATCGFADALFSDGVQTFDEWLDLVDDPEFGGYLDGGADHPFAEWTVIHIPYCTGDVHIGNARADYGDDVVIEHRGFVNASTALDWVYDHYPSPQTVMVSGCSAGAYGAAFHVPFVADHYADADVSLFADSGGGIITETFLEDSFPSWNADGSLPDFIPALTEVPISELSLTDVYIEVGKTFPDLAMAQTSTAFDQDQIFFFEAMGGTRANWPGLFQASLDQIAEEVPRFRYYRPPGTAHCAGIYPFFFEREVDGQNLADWTLQLATEETLPDTVSCQGAGCCVDPVCEACEASGFEESWCRFCLSYPPTFDECSPEE